MTSETDLLKNQLAYRKKFMENINELHSANNLNTILLELKECRTAYDNDVSI